MNVDPTVFALLVVALAGVVGLLLGHLWIGLLIGLAIVLVATVV